MAAVEMTALAAGAGPPANRIATLLDRVGHFPGRSHRWNVFGCHSSACFDCWVIQCRSPAARSGSAGGEELIFGDHGPVRKLAADGLLRCSGSR